MNKKGASDLERSLESNDILSKIIVFPINQSKQKSTSTLEKVKMTLRFGIMQQVCRYGPSEGKEEVGYRVAYRVYNDTFSIKYLWDDDICQILHICV